jgi:hypothetical protein
MKAAVRAILFVLGAITFTFALGLVIALIFDCSTAST